MGNCLQSGRCAGKVSDMVFIKIMKVDGKMLEYRAPLLVKELLVDYAGHSVVNAEAVCRRLSPETELKPSELYYLLPDSHFPNDGRCVSDSQGNVDLKQIAVVDSSGGENGGVVRLKVLITKQQLAQLMCDNSPKETSLGDLLLSLRSKLQTANPSSYRDSARTAMNSSAWRPALESIPEGADVLIT